ncbi:hypothetical protein Ait01nite_013710 [Actinoplanes italicus]|uniref:HEAT repeat protein n=1 Tax=Actinoplanes italicus TaxID=113567 RepID=A0A2T0KH79_9ACTN|nr:hypothetical protein [Actinoplanes italicus]PRX22804.1 hypothetical protein CLV67_104332 [Actinoplanes italicus]GIE28326.1 hypothetical protein Ait01nite_013710 [Actinoplanes italicus]
MPQRTTGPFVKDVDLGGLAPGGDGQSVVRALGGLLWLGPRTVPDGPRVVAGLIELAALPGNTNRVRILRLLGQAARNNRYEWRSDGLPVKRALRAGLPVLLGFLEDPDPEVRRVVPYLMCEFLDEDAGVTALLHARTAVETDDFALVSQLRALDELTEAYGDPGRVAPAAWFRSWLDHRSPAVRMAAAGAVARRDTDGAGLAAVALGCLDAEPESLWRDSPWRHGMAWLAGRLSEHPDVGERVALAMFGRNMHGSAPKVLDRWRRPMPELWEAAAAGLTDDDDRVRKECALLFAAADPTVTSAYADALWEAAAGGVESAIVPLTLIGDERALPALQQRLVARRIASYTIVTAFRQILISDLLAPMAGHAERLLPAIRALLAGEPVTDLADLLGGLALWGPASAAAVPELGRLLTTGHAEQACRVLGAIGPPAASLAGELRELALGRRRPEPVRAPVWHGTQRAAWAHWRVTGDPSVALPVIGGATRRGPGHALLRCLAELGPVAAGHAGDVRVLLSLPGDWNRVEAAHAYWRITGDAGPVVPVLLDLMAPLRTGRNSPVLRRAVHCAGAVGSAGAPVLPLLDEVLAAPRRSTDPLSRRPILDDLALLEQARTASGLIRSLHPDDHAARASVGLRRAARRAG